MKLWLILTEFDRESLIDYLRGCKIPLTFRCEDGVARSLRQNNLLNDWYHQIARERGDTTFEEVRAECKYSFGFPILARDDPEIDNLVKFLKSCIAERLGELLVHSAMVRMIRIEQTRCTSRMTVKQMSEYMAEMQRHWAEQGIVLEGGEERVHKEGQGSSVRS